MPPDTTRPGPLPKPPEDLQDRSLPIVKDQGPWYRLHASTREPIYFGSTGLNRFDAPADEYGVCYVGSDTFCAFVETFGWLTGARFVTATALSRRTLTRIEAIERLRVVDLTGPGLARLGADERLCAGDHAAAQRWALALWAHPERPDGLCYRARHDPSRVATAIFDRAAGSLRAVSLGLLIESQNTQLLADLLATYEVGLVDDTV